MADVDDKLLRALTVNWTENGVLKVRELDKVVLSTSTSWTTIAFLFQERESDGWRAPKVSIRRYRKRGGKLVVDKHMTLSTEKQAVDLAAAIGSWFAKDGVARTLEVQAGSAPREGVSAAPIDDEK